MVSQGAGKGLVTKVKKISVDNSARHLNACGRLKTRCWNAGNTWAMMLFGDQGA